MLSSSKNEAKQEARFAARLDVLMERVDTLASTVATTASAIAKKDGEIAALRRDLEARDQTLQALLQQTKKTADTPPADLPVDVNELRSLRNAVAALTKERASGVNAAHIEELVATVRALAERVDALAAAAAAPSVPLPDPVVTARVDAVAAELVALRTALERQPHELEATLSTLRDQVKGLAEREAGVPEEELERRFAATHDAIAALRQRSDALGAALEEHGRARTAHASQLEQRFQETDRRVAETEAALASASQRLGAIAGELERAHVVDEEALGRRFDETESALATLGRRIDALHRIDEDDLIRRFEEHDSAFAKLTERLDALAVTVEAASSSLGEKEHELASLQRRFTESSTRIESIVDDIREALHAFPELSVASVEDLTSRLERLEISARKNSETGARMADDLSSRIDTIDQRLATVADEVSRAKTLWPVALRSLEARLEDVAHARKPEPTILGAAAESGSAEMPEDLLAGLRDSLQEMELVAAEMARASEALTGVADDEPEYESDAERAQQTHPGEAAAPESERSEQHEAPKAAAAGATIVPLRAGDP